MTYSFFNGGGELGKLIREFDWDSSPLGAPSQWPQALRTAVGICLQSKFGMYIAWGPDYLQFYNDYYRPILGATKHPAIGKGTAETFKEAWDVIGPLFQQAMDGNAVGEIDYMLALDRHGYLEECYFTFSYSPIYDGNKVGGVLVVVSETTREVIHKRRLDTIQVLAESIHRLNSVDEIWKTAGKTLARYNLDFPIVVPVTVTEESGNLTPVSSPEETPHSDELIKPLIETLVKTSIEQDKITEQSDLLETFGAFSSTPWPNELRHAVALPIGSQGLRRKFGALLVVTSPRLRFDDDYLNFLEIIAREISTALGNAVLYEEAQKRAEELAEIDRVKTKFFTNISHEFRTPLTLILDPLEELASANLSSRQSNTVSMAKRNALRLLRMVNSLLNFSRISAGRIRACYEPTNLGDFTADIASTFRSLIEKAGINFIVDCGKPAESVYVDRNMWEQIVLNLISNAFKFTLEGEIKVSMFDDHHCVKLEIHDTGIGISNKDKAKIFERFSKIENSRGRSIEGTGIGLALVRELVQLHGGEISFDSTEGAGTIFRLSIPTGTAHLPANQVRENKTLKGPAIKAHEFVAEATAWMPDEPQKDGVSLQGGVHIYMDPGEASNTQSVLVVDDNADMRKALHDLISNRYQVYLASNGLEALELLQSTKPDLLLTDIMMPGLDGFELLKKIRKDANLKNIPVILMSARADEESRELGLLGQADDFITKPFVGREILLRIRQQLTLTELRKAIAKHQAEEKLAKVRLKAAEKIAESEERFRQLTSLSSDWYWEQDEELCLSFSSPGLADALGDKSLVDMGKAFWKMDFRHPESDQWEAFRATQMAHKPFRNFECAKNSKNNELVWMLLSGEPILGDDGNFRGYRGVGINISARKKAEISLVNNQMLLTSIVDNAPIGITLADINGEYVRVNRAFCAMLGYSKAELEGMSLFDTSQKDDIPLHKRLRQKLLTGKSKNETFQKRMYRKDGSLIWTKHSIAAVNRGDGELFYTVAQVQDITEEMAAQNRLHREARYKHILSEFSLRALREENLPRLLDYVAGSLQTRLGVDFVEVIKFNEEIESLEIIAAAGWNRGAAGNSRNIDDQNLVNKFIRFNKTLDKKHQSKPAAIIHSNSDHPSESHTTSLQDRHGVTSGVSIMMHDGVQLYGCLGVYTREQRSFAQEDIQFIEATANVIMVAVARHQTLSMLDENRKMLARAQEITGLGMWQYDVRKNRVTWSRPLQSILGGNLEPGYEMLEDSMKWVHEEDREKVSLLFEKAVKEKRDQHFICRIIRPDGDERIISVHCEAILDDSGKPLKISGTSLDVTDQKNSESRLRESAALLKRLSRRLVEVQDEERRHLASELHDQVGQNLTALDINLGIMSERLQNQDSDVAMRMSDSIKLVDDTFRSIESVLHALRPSRLEDMGLTSALSWKTLEFEKRNEFSVDFAEQGKAVRLGIDLETAVYRAALEALNNIVKHASATHVAIKLSWQGNELIVSITDNGSGFDAHSPENKSGLGMTTMRERLEAFNGTLKVSSKSGEGTEVLFHIKDLNSEDNHLTASQSA